MLGVADLEGALRSFFHSVTFLPANVLLFQAPEYSGQAGAPLPKSDQ